jgi:type I restriction enzyme S subunit
MAFFKLSDICKIAKGKTPISKSVPGLFPLVTTSEERLTAERFDFDGKCVCVPMVSSTGHGHASLKRLQYQEGKFALGTILVALIPKNEKNLIARYLYIYLSVFKDELIVPLMKGSANVSLTLTNLASIKIYLPNINKQKEIIDSYNSCYVFFETLNEEFKAQFDSLKTFRTKILQDAFAGKLIKSENTNNNDHTVLNNNAPHSSPANWEWVSLSELARKIGAGSTPKGGKSVYKSSGVAFLRSQNIQNGFFDLEDVAFIGDDINTRMIATQVEPFDILLNITGASMGRSAVAPANFSKANVSQHVAIIRLKDPQLSSFIHLYILSPYFQNKIQKVQSGISREGLSIRELQKIVMPLIPVEERNQLLKKISDLSDLHQELTNQFFTHAHNLLQGFLKDLFSLNTEIKRYKLTSPFNFSVTVSEINKRKKAMPKIKEREQDERFENININVLTNEFQENTFDFSDIFEKTNIDYDNVKDILFQLLNESKTQQVPYLKIFFDQENSGKMLFKIIQA